MKGTLYRFAIAAVLIFSAGMARAASVDPKLQTFLRGEGERTTKVIALFSAISEEGAPPTRYRHREVVSYLEKKARRAWGRLQSEMAAHPALSREVRLAWVSRLAGGAVLDVTPAGLRFLASSPSVSKIYANHRASQDPVRPSRRTRYEGEVPYDLRETGLDQVRAKYPKLDGSGVMLGSVDTGVDAAHPALRGKIAAFYDGPAGKPGAPNDTAGHGTHTIATMVGEDGKNAFGMAPRAKVVAASSLMTTASISEILRGMEFMLSPEGAAAPRAVNNSWGHPQMPDEELFYRVIEAWDAAGILAVFAAGNDGLPSSIGMPGNHPLALTVGATGRNGALTDFSSRGPARMAGRMVQKPDLTAPGSDIRSAVPGGEYESWDGTSMAAPHVAGGVALLAQASPDLNPAQLRALILKSVEGRDEKGVPLPAPKWNANYGFGKLSIVRALDLLRSTLARSRGAAGGVGSFFFQGAENLDAAAVASLARAEIWTSTW